MHPKTSWRYETALLRGGDIHTLTPDESICGELPGFFPQKLALEDNDTILKWPYDYPDKRAELIVQHMYSEANTRWSSWKMRRELKMQWSLSWGVVIKQQVRREKFPETEQIAAQPELRGYDKTISKNAALQWTRLFWLVSCGAGMQFWLAPLVMRFSRLSITDNEHSSPTHESSLWFVAWGFVATPQPISQIVAV